MHLQLANIYLLILLLLLFLLLILLQALQLHMMKDLAFSTVLDADCPILYLNFTDVLFNIIIPSALRSSL
jgi:hypothetical protein